VAVRVHDNAEEYARGLGQSRRKSHELALINHEEYAEVLHAREGYDVLNIDDLEKKAVDWLSEVAASRLPLDDRNIEKALDGAGYDTVNYHQSLISHFQPPLKAGEGPRQAHPGNWADRTRNLANAYRHQVNGGRVVDHPYSG
jgi:hypothetical protein